MSVRMPVTEEIRPAPEELAQALRSGLEIRWSIPAPLAQGSNPFPPRGNVRSFLEPYADALKYPLPRRRQLLHRLVRLGRYVLRKLSVPWLHVQSRFNLATVSVVEQVERRVRELEASERTLRETVAALQQTLLSCADHEPGQLIDTLEEGLRLRVNQELGGEGKIGQAGLWFEPSVHVRLDRNGPRIERISARILEHIFLHTHLPRPPARLLALGCSNNTNAIEMASLGFQVVGVDARPLPVRHPNFTMIQTHLAELPFEDESFDGAVALSITEHGGLSWSAPEERGAWVEELFAEVFRILKRGGRFIVTLPFGQQADTPMHPVHDGAQLDRLRHAFRVVERGYGVHEGGAWTFTLDEQRAEQLDGSDSLSAVCLLVLERP
ncbi:MAG TPA: class I SAM-dependent methyltransferase [Gemmataceae bacterium]|nr:class I SAM-dependent methyltransferase [Gemmataceae bacterium]